MHVSVKHLPKSTVELTITADAEALKPFRAAAIREISGSVKIDGFRAGHAPEAKIVERVGEETVLSETVNLAVKKLYADAVVSEKLEVVARPDVQVESIDPLKFVATVAVLPPVDLGDYRSITLTKPTLDPSDTEVADFVKELAKKHAIATKVEGRAAKMGDRVEIDFAGRTPDGVALDGTASKNHPLTLGEGNFIPGFEEGVIGMSVGEEKDITVTFPADYHASHLAGKPVIFAIKVHGIEEMALPTFDDAFAKKFEKETWADVETEIREYLADEKKHAARHQLEDALIQELLKKATVEIPDALITEETDFMLHDLKQQITKGGMKWQAYLDHAKKAEDEVVAEMRLEAEKRVKVRLVMNKLIEVENPTVDESEMSAEIAHLRAHGQIGETMPDPLSSEGQRLKHQMRVIKLIDTLANTFAK